MLKLICWVVVIIGFAIAGLLALRALDLRADAMAQRTLLAMQPKTPQGFSADLVAGLPDVAQRYFLHSIAPGAPLLTVARIDMDGDFSLGTTANDPYLAMNATQVLAAPHGFVWSAALRSDEMRLAGSDAYLEGKSWTRFWLSGTVPVARDGGNSDHARAAFGRFVAEAVFWTPAALLPGPDILWEATGDNAARVTLSRGDLQQSVDLIIDENGAVTKVSFDRWSDANPEKTYRLQRFGGHLSEYRTFQGFNLPTRIEAGNLFGTADYFPFFRAHVSAIDFPSARP